MFVVSAAHKKVFYCIKNVPNFVIIMNNDQPATSAENTNDGESAAKRRKGIRKSDEYQRNVVRNSRVKGQQYISYSKRVVEAKQIGPKCK